MLDELIFNTYFHIPGLALNYKVSHIISTIIPLVPYESAENGSMAFSFFHRLAKVSNIRDNQERKGLFFLLRHSLSAQPCEQTTIPSNGER